MDRYIPGCAPQSRLGNATIARVRVRVRVFRPFHQSTLHHPPGIQDVKGEIEEQTLSRYHQKRYYPVIIGDVLKDQYRIITKLGFGAYSTVWLAWDKKSEFRFSMHRSLLRRKLTFI